LNLPIDAWAQVQGSWQKECLQLFTSGLATGSNLRRYNGVIFLLQMTLNQIYNN